MKKKNNKKGTWSVIIYVGNYMRKEKNSSCDLIGVYPTKEAAMFISRKAKYNRKLSFYPKVIPGNAEPTSTKVEGYLKYIKEKEANKQKKSRKI